MPRHQFTTEKARKGGIARSQMPDFSEAGLKGRDVLVERHGRDALLAIVRKWKRRKMYVGKGNGN